MRGFRVGPSPARAVAGALLALLGACGPAPEPVAGPSPTAVRGAGWEVTASRGMDLWQHGMAYVAGAQHGFGADYPLPLYRPGYVDSMSALKAEREVFPTPLDVELESVRESLTVLGGDGLHSLSFLPLYLRNPADVLAAIEVWERSGGDPRRARSEAAAQMVGFLSSLYPDPDHRSAIASFAAVLAREDTAFYQRYWADAAPRHRRIEGEVARVWRQMEPELRDFLAHQRLISGELMLPPAMGIEGRIVASGTPTPRAVSYLPPADAPEHAVWAFLHELLYPLVGEVISESVEEELVSGIGAATLSARAAVRGGAMLLESAVPERADAYRRFFIARFVGEPSTRLTPDEAFEESYPLPESLESALREAIGTATAGF